MYKRGLSCNLSFMLNAIIRQSKVSMKYIYLIFILYKYDSLGDFFFSYIKQKVKLNF